MVQFAISAFGNGKMKIFRILTIFTQSVPATELIDALRHKDIGFSTFCLAAILAAFKLPRW